MNTKLKFAKTIAYWRRRIAEQEKWIAEHGGSRDAYVARYGDYGNGGEAIFDADWAELDSLRATLKRWESK